MQYRILSWHINTEENTLSDLNTGQQFHVEPRTMDVLLLMVKNPLKVISRQEFLDEVWGDSVVVEESLSRCISLLRKILGDKATSPDYIQTVHKKGYKLLIQPQVIDVARLDNDVSEAVDTPSDHTNENAVRKKHSRELLVSVISLAILVVLLGIYYLAPSPVNPPVQNQSINADTFTTSDLSTLRQNLFRSNSESVIIRLISDVNNSLSYTVEMNSIESKNSGLTRYVILGNDQQELWELTRGVSNQREKTNAIDDVLFVLESMQTSYLYQVNANLPGDIQQKYQQALYRLDMRGAENLDIAIALFDEVINHSPDFVEAIINKAAAIRSLNFYRPGLEARKQRKIQYDLLLKQAASINPTHPIVKAVNARFDINQKNWHEYELSLQNAVAQAPTCYLCVRSLAEFYVNIGYYEKAANFIEESLNYFPLSRQMHALLGEVYIRQGSVSKAREQSEILKALGSGTATDSLAIDINVYSQTGDVEKVRQLLNDFVDKHPNTKHLLNIFEAKVNGRYEEMRRLINELPYLDFNLGLASGKIDAVYERLVNNVSKGNIRDLGLLHGWLHEASTVNKFYPDALLALKNHQNMHGFLADIGIIDYWEENDQWPDYCEKDKYAKLRPTYCPT